MGPCGVGVTGKWVICRMAASLTTVATLQVVQTPTMLADGCCYSSALLELSARTVIGPQSLFEGGRA